MDGKDFTTAPLALTVKKTVPKLTAKAVKLNSFFEDTQEVVLTGGVPKDISVTNPPDWLTPTVQGESEKSLTLTYTGDANVKQSGTVTLSAVLEDWAVKVPVTVSVSAAPTKPKLALKPASLSLLPVGGDSASAMANITPASFGDWDLVVVSIKEGAADADDALSVDVSARPITVSSTGAVTDGLAHTYKVTLGVVRTTFIIDENGNISHIMPKVKPDTNAAEVLELL